MAESENKSEGKVREQLLLLLFFIICAWYFWMTLSQHLVSSLSQGIFSLQLYFCFADVVFEALVLSIFFIFSFEHALLS